MPAVDRQHDALLSVRHRGTPGVFDRVAGRTLTPDEAERRRGLDGGGQPLDGTLRRSGGTRRHAPARPARPAAGAAPAGAAGGDGGGAASAFSSGARSASVDHRRQFNRHRCCRRAGRRRHVARSFSAGPSATAGAVSRTSSAAISGTTTGEHRSATAVHCRWFPWCAPATRPAAPVPRLRSSRRAPACPRSRRATARG